MPKLTVIDSEPIGRSVQSTLREVMNEAKAGDVSAVAIAIVHRDGSISAHWSELPSMPAMLGSISHLEFRLNRQLDES